MARLRLVLMSFLALVLAATTVTVTASPAAAAPAGCAPTRIADPVSLYSTTHYFGWAEWLFCTAGASRNVQFVRLHIPGYESLYNSKLAYTVWDVATPGTYTWWIRQGWADFHGTYDVGSWYEPDSKVCVWFNADSDYGEVFFGKNYKPINNSVWTNYCG